MSDPTNKDENDKPDIKIVSINRDINITEQEEEEDLQTRLVQLYAYSREVFIEIEDYEQQEEAVKYLRKAFLAALNPLQTIDNQFEEWVEEEE